jgi:hypothetical protein
VRLRGKYKQKDKIAAGQVGKWMNGQMNGFAGLTIG